jgi:hypothetical protein
MQGDIFRPYACILALAFLFFKHGPKNAADTGVPIGGGIKIASVTYADDIGMCCNDEDEANRRLTTTRGGLRKDGGKEISQPKTFALAFESRAHISDVTEEAIVATEGLVPCEFCDKNFEDNRSLYRHQTGISPHLNARQAALVPPRAPGGHGGGLRDRGGARRSWPTARRRVEGLRWRHDGEAGLGAGGVTGGDGGRHDGAGLRRALRDPERASLQRMLQHKSVLWNRYMVLEECGTSYPAGL